MNLLTPDEMNKLPKWAQQYIKTLHTNLIDLKAEKRGWFEDNAETGQVLLPYFHGIRGLESEDQYLGRRQHVRFVPDNLVGTGHYLECNLDSQRGQLMIHGSMGPILIEPHASNVVAITLEK